MAVGVAAVLRLFAVNDWSAVGLDPWLPYALFAGMLLGVFPIAAGLAVSVRRHKRGEPVAGAAILAAVSVWIAQYIIFMLVARIPPGLPDMIYLLATVLTVFVFVEMIAPHQRHLHFDSIRRAGRH
jgi:drug/metabolite transporter (DMT)-like permease